MIQMKDIDFELADFLLENVIHKRGYPTYQEVADELSKRLNRKINPHLGLRVHLSNVSSLCFELGLPLISARVIYKDATSSRTIGEGFHTFAQGFRSEYTTMDPVAAWKNELRLIRQCQDWHRLREYLEGKSIDPITNREKVDLSKKESTQMNPSTKEPLFHISDPVFPDEIGTPNIIKEGALKLINVNIRERNSIARKKCIEYYGAVCSVCDKDMGDIYGHEFKGKIHVHHLNPISEYDEEHEIDPIKDLRPVCPNCHTIIHSGIDKPFSIEEVKAFIKNNEKLKLKKSEK